VHSFNKIHSYKHNFVTETVGPAHMDLKIRPLTVPCTINPPSLDVRCSASFQGDNPGFISDAYPFSTTSSIDPPNPDFTWIPEGIFVPVDGCYSVLWESSSWGVGYFSDKIVTVGITHNDIAIRLVEQRTTVVISLFGPLIFSYVPASPIYAVIEAKAGDRISAFLTENDISQGYPWIGQETGLHGFFASTGWYGSRLDIELIAEAEG
jgi:hypothetical protein